MKARELKELKSSNPQDLIVKLGDLKAELFNLRFQLATGQLENPMRIKEVKKSISRIVAMSICEPRSCRLQLSS